MNLTDAKREADRTLDFGYFRPDDTHVFLICRRCRERVGSTVRPWARDGLAEHLTGCGEAG